MHKVCYNVASVNKEAEMSVPHIYYLFALTIIVIGVVTGWAARPKIELAPIFYPQRGASKEA